MRTEVLALSAGRRVGGASGCGNLENDERGAILVLGIFMCACMVGALWYLAGIGSAIVFRERMQEASDAIAFSGAVLHARGMNLIVLINFVMAAILAIRVALRVTQLALVITGTVLSLIPFAGAGLAAPFFAGAEGLESPISTTRPLINNALKALSNVQKLIARLVPPAALIGSGQVGEKYQPILNTSNANVLLNRAGSPIAVADGLPTTDDTEDKLCRKAGEAVGSVLTMAAPIPRFLADAISGALGRLVAAGGAYFCEMGTGGGPPDVSSDLDQGAEDACDKERDRLQRLADEAQRRYDDACTSYNCTITTPTAAQQTELDGLARDRDIAEQKVRDFDRPQCVEDKKQEGRDRFNQKTGGGNTPPASSNNGQGMTPKKIKDGWKNGIRDAQVIAVVSGRIDSLKAAETGARAGAWATPVTYRVPTSASYSLAQAEFFFDCSGPWTGGDCNEENEAMWRFRWRARLRRFNSPFAPLNSITSLAMGAETFRDFTQAAGTTGFQNAALQLELAGMVARRFASADFVIH
jgi:hypothetical protein